jgi:DNA-directed RNA polymerase subunit RPC12/RpoP
MKKVFDEMDYESQPLACENCGWKNTAGDANLIDFYGISSVKELHCPQCDNTIGIIKSKNDEGFSRLF